MLGDSYVGLKTEMQKLKKNFAPRAFAQLLKSKGEPVVGTDLDPLREMVIAEVQRLKDGARQMHRILEEHRILEDTERKAEKDERECSARGEGNDRDATIECRSGMGARHHHHGSCSRRHHHQRKPQWKL